MAAPETFGQYAEIYDLLYRDKDYAAESAFVAALIRKYLGPGNPVRVIDLACGTGRHVFELLQAGFQVAGNDVSPDMIAVARKAAAQRKAKVLFHAEPFQSCAKIGGRYHAAIAMFASLGYLTTRSELAAALACIRDLLEPDGLLIFDVWNGPAVVRDFAPMKERKAVDEAMAVSRVSRTVVDQEARIATVDFEFSVSSGGQPPRVFSERHRVRYYDPQEMTELLQAGGFEVLLCCPFMDPARQLAASDWNATFVARRK